MRARKQGKHRRISGRSTGKSVQYYYTITRFMRGSDFPVLSVAVVDGVEYPILSKAVWGETQATVHIFCEKDNRWIEKFFYSKKLKKRLESEKDDQFNAIFAL